MTRVAIMGSPEKANATEAMTRLAGWLKSRAELVHSELSYDSTRVLASKPDALFVLGGDGTMLAAVRGLGKHQIPIVGVNLGKLGFLAEFTVEQIEREGEFLFQNGFPVTRRVMLNVKFDAREGRACETLAVNDCVVFAGPPFRMIEMTVEADGERVATMRGDGVIVASASGSTAHNLSAGGPILEPTAEAFVVTPICPHALTFRPLVLAANRRIELAVTRANEGTTLSIDGFTRRAFQPSDRVTITRFPADCLLVRNPRRTVWYALHRKLMWGQPPNGSP